jgi:hypothetical protein
MELVPIIYTSTLVVFSLLGSILLFSFIYSKVLGKNNKVIRHDKKEFINSKSTATVASVGKRKNNSIHRNERILNDNEKKEIAFRAAQTNPKIEQKLIANNKVRVVKKTENLRRDRMRSDYINSASRYSVVNSFAREEKKNNNLYAKFSKMSVEYSQTI